MGTKKCNTPVLCYNPNLPPRICKDSRDRRGFHISQSHLEGLWKLTFNSCENKKGPYPNSKRSPTKAREQNSTDSERLHVAAGHKKPCLLCCRHASSPLTQPGVNLNKSEHNTAVSGVHSGLSMRLGSEKRKESNYWYHSFFNTLMLILGQIGR